MTACLLKLLHVSIFQVWVQFDREKSKEIELLLAGLERSTDIVPLKLDQSKLNVGKCHYVCFNR